MKSLSHTHPPQYTHACTRCVLHTILIGAKKDFSCTDRKFAANLGLPFQTPEEHFHGLPKCSKFSWGEFDPRSLDYSTKGPKLVPSDAKLHSDQQEVVIFVGCPGSGKSTFYTKHMKPKGYIHVNRDTLGSWQKCVTECSRILSAGKSVVVDNTSPDKESRLRYIDVARKHKVPIRCFRFMTTIAHAKHNNRFRELTLKSSSYKKVNDMVFNMYKSKFCEPELGEGFSEIVKVDFSPSFENDHHVKLYKCFLE